MAFGNIVAGVLAPVMAIVLADTTLSIQRDISEFTELHDDTGIDRITLHLSMIVKDRESG
jgi:hypothetical protein